MAPVEVTTSCGVKIPLTVPLHLMENDDIVITGISCRLPESDSMAEFREHLINKEDMITADNRRWEPGEFIFGTYVIQVIVNKSCTNNGIDITIKITKNSKCYIRFHVYKTPVSSLISYGIHNMMIFLDKLVILRIVYI